MSACRQVLSLAVVVAALGVFGCGPQPTAQPTGSVPPATTSNPPSGTNPTKDTPQAGEAKADFVLTAAEYQAEFSKSGNDLANKYVGKQIEVTGVIQTLDRSFSTSSFHLGQTADAPHTFDCSLKDSPAHPYSLALPGQTVKIRGKGLLADKVLTLSSCEVVSATGTGPVIVPATDWSKEYKADKEATKAKYKAGTYLIVTGEVVSTKTVKVVGNTVVVLTQSSDGEEVECVFENVNPADKERNAKIAQGQKIKVLGKRSPDSVLGCVLQKCAVLDEKK